jgi:hypothetical protein
MLLKGVFLTFAAKDHDLEGPHPGPDSLFLQHLKGIKSGKGVALRKEQGLFCILFVAAWTKRMASGGTRPAGYAFRLSKNKLQQINTLLLLDYAKKQPERAGLHQTGPFIVTLHSLH